MWCFSVLLRQMSAALYIFFLHCYFFFRLELGFFSLFLLIQLHLLPSSSLTPFSWIITVYSMFLVYSNNLKKKHRTTFGELQKNIFSKLRLDSFVSDEHRVDYPSFQPFSHLIFSLCSFHIAPFPFFLLFFCCVSLK